MRKKKSALLYSIISLMLCLSMLVGTTFAWFTDSVKTGINTIASGVLDVELYHSNTAVTDELVDVNTNLFKDLNGNDILWEPGVVSYENLRITNAGDLALCYEATLNTANENYVQDPSGAQYGLSQILKIGFVEGGITATTRDGVVNSVQAGSWTTLSNFLQRGSLLPEGAGESEHTWGVVVYWEPGDSDNYWNLNNGKQLNEGEVLSIDLGIKLVAAQEIYEEDSFGNNYDVMAGFTKGKIDVTVSTPVAVNAEGKTEAPVSLGNASAGVSAEIPAGVEMADGVNTLTLTVKTMDESQANVKLAKGETSTSLDVHVDGLAEDNTTPVLVKLERVAPSGLYNSNIALYHVENGVTNAMTQVTDIADLDAHNEFYYDANTGDVTVMMASFSEVFVAYKMDNEWDGTVDTSWYAEGDYTLKDAADLAGFAKIVGGMAEGIERDSFAGKTVTLGANIDLCDKLWYPIGYYFTDDENADGTTGDYYCDLYPFEGTFDGNGKTIANFCQNTWEMKGDDPHYDLSKNQYYNSGMGLFGFINNGTVQNLVIYGMKAEGEFTDIGCITAYARGTCTFDSIRISDVSCYSYNCRTAGIVGYDWIGDAPSTYTFRDIEIDPTCTFGALWGSWDVACAGIMGYMNDTSSATFTNCNVGPVLDVYNDVCANYQYYQYRYSGMMIGTVGKDGDPTDMSGKITFDNCTVCYGDWSNYYYCEFVKNSLASYTHDYQFSRVPKDEITFNANGEISGCTHDHAAAGKETIDGNEVLIEDKTAIMIPFRQIYTGYGWGAQAQVEGVNVVEAKYTIIYVNNGKVLDVTYIFDNTIPQSVKNDAMVELANASMAALNHTNLKFSHWMNAGSTKVETVDAGNTTNIVLYPSYEDLYTATFVDQQGNILDWTTFTKTQYSTLSGKVKDVVAPETDELAFDYWEVHVTDNNGNTTVKKAWSDYLKDSTFGKTDIALYPVYLYNGDVNLIPVDTDGDGTTNYYQVGGYGAAGVQTVVEIPDYVNGIPVTEINANAFSSYTGIHVVVIPTTVTYIGNNAISDAEYGWFEDGETVTIYYEGSYKQWSENVSSDGKWFYGLSENSRIFFLNGTNKVDLAQGYLEVSVKNSGIWNYSASLSYTAQVPASFVSEHTKNCDCKVDGCSGNLRPDAHYWN